VEKGITPLPCAPSAWEGGWGEGFCPRSGAVSGCAFFGLDLTDGFQLVENLEL